MLLHYILEVFMLGIDKKETMKRATFNLKPSQIQRIDDVAQLAISKVDGINKSDIFRLAIDRGLDSIEEELKAGE